MKTTLQKIKRAGTLIATGTTTYSCNALEEAGTSEDFTNLYWMKLYESPGQYYTVDERISELSYVSDYCAHQQRCREVRLMMLAWLHEMVRTGEFDRIAPPEEHL